jgi:uncharacterized DUF497 family protein
MNRARAYDFDPAKEVENQRKHRVGFDDGFAVLQQDASLLWEFLDQRSDYGEDRWIVVGPLPGQWHTLLHVTWTERGDRIHIISVRRATPAEKRSYEHRHRRPC